MRTKITDPAQRAAVTQKTLEKYRGRPFIWGKNDCMKLARAHLIAMGYALPKIPPYSSAATAARRIREQGAETLEDLLAQYLTPIAPAYLRAGDLATVKSDEPISAIIIAAGNGKFLGWAPEAEGLQVVNVQPERGYYV